MILTAHQPAYLPWLGLFHKIALADMFVLFDRVQYVPKDWISRNKIKTNSGPLLLSVPVRRKEHFEKKIDEIIINNEEKWQQKHWKSIYLNYKGAPFFDHYADFLNDVYSTEWEFLADLNLHMLKGFLSILNIPTKVVRAREYEFRGAKSDLVLDMCVALRAEKYIFGELGEDYADKEKFNQKGIELIFQKYKHPIYRQLHGEFAPYMSIIDLLFNEGPNSYEVIMRDNLSNHELEAKV